MISNRNNKAIGQKFHKRRHSFLKKGNDLKKLCGAEIYVLLKYTSTSDNSWPPTPEQIVSFHSISKKNVNERLRKEQSYPLLDMKTLAHYETEVKS
jgi:hypothetical protein